MVPFTHGQWLAKHIPTAQARFKSDHGHISILCEYKNNIVDELLEYLK